MTVNSARALTFLPPISNGGPLVLSLSKHEQGRCDIMSKKRFALFPPRLPYGDGGFFFIRILHVSALPPPDAAGEPPGHNPPRPNGCTSQPSLGFASRRVP